MADNAPNDNTETAGGFTNFRPSSIRDCSSILVAGPHMSGKSCIVRDVVHGLHDRVRDTYVYTGTMDPDHPWEESTVNVQNVDVHLPDEHLANVLTTRDDALAASRERGEQCPAAMIVFEDLDFLHVSMWRNRSIRELVFNGRYWRCFTIAAVQNIAEIDMAARNMFDYAIFTRCPDVQARRRIHTQYAGVFASFAEFEIAFEHCTSNHGAMIVDCRCASRNPRDSVHRYDARVADHP